MKKKVAANNSLPRHFHCSPVGAHFVILSREVQGLGEDYVSQICVELRLQNTTIRPQNLVSFLNGIATVYKLGAETEYAVII